MKKKLFVMELPDGIDWDGFKVELGWIGELKVEPGQVVVREVTPADLPKDVTVKYLFWPSFLVGAVMMQAGIMAERLGWLSW